MESTQEVLTITSIAIGVSSLSAQLMQKEETKAHNAEESKSGDDDVVQNVECGICFDTLPRLQTSSNLCGDTSCLKCVACSDCLKHYFEGVVKEGYDGACPPMKCPFHPKKIVPSAIWKSLVDPSVFITVEKRAKAVLSLQCIGCHSRYPFNKLYMFKIFLIGF
jgi:hypothetical protein